MKCPNIRTVEGFEGGQNHSVFCNLVAGGEPRRRAQLYLIPTSLCVAFPRVQDGFIILGSLTPIMIARESIVESKEEALVDDTPTRKKMPAFIGSHSLLH